jgi:hypothetical protein
MNKFPLIALLLVTGICCANAPLSLAAGGTGGAVRALTLAQSDGPTLDQAVEQVRREYNGRIVSAETKVRGNREIHYIKVLTEDGKVKTVTVPGRTLGNG